MGSKAETETFQVIEEEARIHKRAVSTGRVRIRTPIDAKSEIASARLEEHQVEITRVPVNKAVVRTPAVRTENDIVIIPVMEEVLIVEKQLILKEELHVRRRVIEDRVEVPVTLRKQRAVVERLEAATERKRTR
ncbi:MAG TPA: DUF2382 domain-containing protein [Xanthobacteraceae bacterium]|jgi:uncharacterized protein (TIGR02271 family)